MTILVPARETSVAKGPSRSHLTELLATAGFSVAVAVTLGLVSVRAEVPLREYQIKAAFVSKFLRFVEWAPAAAAESNPSRPLAVCALGGGLIDEAFGDLRTEHVGDRAIAYRHVDSPQDAAGCHVLFVPATYEAPPREVLAALDGAAVLTIGETEQFTDAGGIIGFVYRKNTLRFVINLDAATRTGLKIRSQLLTLAVDVQQGHAGGNHALVP